MKATSVMTRIMRRSRWQITALFCLVGGSRASVAADVTELHPAYRREQVLVVSDGAQPYLAFPALLDLGEDVLVSYKRGRSHGDDSGAALDMIRLNKVSGRMIGPRMIAQSDDMIMQMGEWVRFPNGDIASYIDVCQPGDPARIGLRSVRSIDGGRTFGPMERVGVVDGVEYGYSFEAVTHGRSTWMLAMTFANLTGGYSVSALRPSAGSVDVIRSDDNGRTWRFVRNLSREFGDIPINESTFLRHGDGFLVSTRGYDNRQRLHLTDADFKVLKQVDLTEEYSFINSYIGRPRLFERDSRVYLLGRNWTQPPSAAVNGEQNGSPHLPPEGQLCLFWLDPANLAVTAYAVLDNAEMANVTDAYYAVPYFREDGGRTYFEVITYKGMDGQPPQIVRLEYLWNEIR
jgi:hypothetical protein